MGVLFGNEENSLGWLEGGVQTVRARGFGNSVVEGNQ